MSRLLFRLDFPEGLGVEAVVSFMRSLGARSRHGWLRVADPVTFEVLMAGGQLRWLLGVEHREAQQVLAGLRHAVPNLSVVPTDEVLPPVVVGWELRLSSSRRPLTVDAPEEIARAVLSALLHAERGEVVRLHWLVGPWLPRRVVAPPHRAGTHDGELLALREAVLNAEQVKAWRDKQAEPVFGVVGRIGISARTPGRRRLLRQRLVGALQLSRAPGVGFERRLTPEVLVPGRLDRLAQPAFGWPCVLNAAEVAAVVGWPIGNPLLAGVSYRGRRQLPPVPGTMQGGSSGRVTGTASFPGAHVPVGVSTQAGLQHTHVLGPSGVGKSTLLANLIIQDITAGRGVVVFDVGAKGDLTRDVLDRVPKTRVDDVVVLDPADEAPVGLNVLTGASPELVADGVVSIVRELWADSWGPRTADVLHHGLLTLARCPGMTLCELPPLLLDGGFRARVLERLGGDPLGVGPFWAWYQALSEGERASVVGPVLNKLRAFTQRPAIRAVIGQATGVDLGRVLAGSGVLLVSLPSGQLGGDTASLLGSLLMTRLWAAITARSQLPAGRRPAVTVYLDEFQQLLRLPLSLTDALVQARGLGAGFVLAHQHLGQLPEAVRSAVLANTQSKIVFRLGRSDAATMAKELGGGLSAEDLQGLGSFETYQSLHVIGGAARPASVTTLALPPVVGSASAVRASSRRRFGQPRSSVDAELLARRNPPAADGVVGVRRRGARS